MILPSIANKTFGSAPTFHWCTSPSRHPTKTSTSPLHTRQRTDVPTCMLKRYKYIDMQRSMATKASTVGTMNPWTLITLDSCMNELLIDFSPFPSLSCFLLIFFPSSLSSPSPFFSSLALLPLFLLSFPPPSFSLFTPSHNLNSQAVKTYGALVYWHDVILLCHGHVPSQVPGCKPLPTGAEGYSTTCDVIEVYCVRLRY